MKHFDIVLDNNDEILIENGDFVISESTLQHIKMYMNLNSGELRRFPSIGANMLSYRGELNDFYRIINHIDTQLQLRTYDRCKHYAFHPSLAEQFTFTQRKPDIFLPGLVCSIPKVIDEVTGEELQPWRPKL